MARNGEKFMQKLKQEKKFGIGQNMRRLRQKMGYTQVQVAAKLGVYGIDISRETYNKIENNNYSIRIRELLALKMIFRCEYSDFFEGLEIKDCTVCKDNVLK